MYQNIDSRKDFGLWSSIFMEESEERLNIDPRKLCRYGVPALDHALCAIGQKELVVIAADSGAGKSDLGIQIAQYNASNNKKVALFYLEGGEQEAIARIKWKAITSKYFKDRTLEIPKYSYVDINYTKWCWNDLTEQERRQYQLIESEIYGEMKTLLKDNLFMYKAKTGLTLNDFLVSTLDFHTLEQKAYGKELSGKMDLDLIVIDHLQYFSLTSGVNEIQEITDIVRKVKNITDEHHVPVVLISHLRKKSKDRGIPDQEDIYGSSNIPKIANTAIIIAPDTEEDNLRDGIFPTYFRIVKSRVGIKSNIVIKCDFSLDERRYADTYKVYRLNQKGYVHENPISIKDLPHWAEGVKNEYGQEATG